MAEHPPLLDTTQILSSDISLLSAPIVSADGTQQVILVQVNPGEAFTIRREDGQFQCITELAQIGTEIICSPDFSFHPLSHHQRSAILEDKYLSLLPLSAIPKSLFVDLGKFPSLGNGKNKDNVMIFH